IVERMRRVGRAVVFEHVALEPFERNRLQKTRRHDAVGIDVIAAHRETPAADAQDFLRLAHAVTRSSIVRTSTTSPAIAAAATMAGLMRSVRPVGLPWRPLKFRFDDEAQI